MNKITQKDRGIIRNLAGKVADAAADPVMRERRSLWKKHNSLKPCRPMILVFPEGSWRELLPDAVLECGTEEGRRIEFNLRSRLYGHEHLDSDNVVEKDWPVSKEISDTGWGITPKWHDSPDQVGARGFDPVIIDGSDLEKMKYPEVSYDESRSSENLEFFQDLFGDLLDVRLKGLTHVSFHLMNYYTSIRGLEQVMLDMYENPGMLHDAMAFLAEGHERKLKQYSEMNLFELNNDGTYHSSGGVGYTDELPISGFDPGRVRPCDIWASAEAQEMAQVSPEMHEEFILRHEKRLLSHFGLNGYGCCEDLTRKLDYVFKIPNLRRISISPWADVDECAVKLKGRYIFSWKPNPSHLVGSFNAAAIRSYIGHTVETARRNNCVLEIILKDTHTVENHPERFDEWTRIAREMTGSN
ncbi:MAG: hypothetical protein WAX69_21740 [Victivallales bacterium]